MNLFHIAVAIQLTFFVGILVIRNISRPASRDRLATLRRRLRDYAAMKKGYKVWPSVSRSEHHSLLKPAEHDILLGIIKKVEAKNGVMATIWALFFACVTTAAFSKMDNNLPLASTASQFILMGVPFIAASIIGTRQIDNFLKGGWDCAQMRDKVHIYFRRR